MTWSPAFKRFWKTSALAPVVPCVGKILFAVMGPLALALALALYREAIWARSGSLPSKGPRESGRDWIERLAVVVALSEERSMRSWIERAGVALPARASLTLSLLDPIH